MADTRNKREVVDIGKFTPYDHPQYGAGAIREVTYIDGTVERRFFYHGTEKEGEGAADGGYLVDTKVDPKIRADWDRGTPPSGPQRTPEQQTTDSAAAALARREQQERERNAALPPDQDPAYETDADRRARAQATITRQGADAERARQQTRQEEADARATADRARALAPKPQQDQSGAWGYWTTDTPPKWVPIAGGPAAPQTPVQVNGTWGVWKPGANGGAPTFEPIANAPVKPSDRPIPASAPRFTPNYNLPDLGLTAYNQQLMDWVNSGATGATREIAGQLIEQAGGLATQTASHGTTLAGQAATARGQDITQRGQDIGEVQSRRSSANDMFQNALKSTDEGARRLMGGDEALAGEAMRAALNLGRLNAQAAGGMQQIPQVPQAYVAALGGAPGTTDTQVHVSNGQVSVSPPGAPPLGVQAAPGGFDPQAAAAGRSNAAAVPPPAPTASAMGPGSPGWNQPAYMPTGPLVRTRDPWGNEGVMNQRDVERSNAMPGGQITVLGPATAPSLSDGTSPFLPGAQPVGMAPGNPYTTALGGSARPAFQPDRQALKARFPDLSDQDIDEVIHAHMTAVA